MKAVQLHGYGGIEQLRYEEIPTPEPGSGEVLVRVISTSVNPIDLKLRSGAMKDVMPLDFPVVLGRDVAGEVTAVGPDVKQFQVGDRVMGLVNRSYAEYLTAKAADLCSIPDGLDAAEAGALPLVLQTGTQLIELGVAPQKMDVVLVTGAAGSVGRTAIFAAKEQGAHVIAGVRKNQKEEAESLGANEVVALDDDVEVSKLQPLDAIADTVGGETIAKLLPRLKKDGRLATVVGKPPAAEQAGIDIKEVYAKPDPAMLLRVAEEVAAGRLNIPIVKRMSLQDTAQAQEIAEKGAKGKILLVP